MSLYPVPGTTLHFGDLPGWGFQLAHDGKRFYGVWSIQGRNVLAMAAGEA
jgi:hypothetical protein